MNPSKIIFKNQAIYGIFIILQILDLIILLQRFVVIVTIK